MPARNVLDLPFSPASSQLSLVTVPNSRVQIHQLDFRDFHSMWPSFTSTPEELICAGAAETETGEDRLPSNAARQ
jgi:hypothetical protein